MGKIELIEQAIADATVGKSKLPVAALQIGGYTSDKVRHLLNNLGAISTNYLEIGVHRGATFVAAMYNNTEKLYGTAIDNFSELAEDGGVREELLSNLTNFIWPSYYTFLQMDCFSSTRLVPNKIDLYFYDGNHSEDSHTRAITHYWAMMEDEFIFVVDDYDWDFVQKGTWEGLKVVGAMDKIKYHAHLKCEGTPQDSWHNGVGIFLIKK